MSPSEATNEVTRAEWRELGFYYFRDDEICEWRLIGTVAGFRKLVALLDDYVANPRSDALSAHQHYGPYMYLKVTTWDAPEVVRDGVRGATQDLARLRGQIESVLSSARPGQTIRIDKEYAPSSTYSLVLEVREGSFDPADADPELAGVAT